MEPEPEPEPEPAVPLSALAERFEAAGMAGLGCDERAAALSWYAPESQRRDAGAQSARQEQARAAAQAWPPAHWEYTKRIVGSEESRFDYAYISTFDFECWHRRIAARPHAVSRFTTMKEPPISLALSEAQILALCDAAYARRTAGASGASGGLPPAVLALAETVREAVAQRTGSASRFGDWFVRLSGRSPKDVLIQPCRSAEDVITAIIASARTFDDLVAY
eukprot:COSAG04_NODE_9681_length_841_cov_0.884097_1_plen_221_part_01